MLSDAIGIAIRWVQEGFGTKTRIGPSKTPAYTHSVAVGLDLEAYGYGIETVLAGILHDAIEDAGLTEGRITSVFGERVARAVTNCSFDPVLGDTPEGEDALQQSVIALAEAGDILPLIVKLADCKHNLRTCRHLRPEIQKRFVARAERWTNAGRRLLRQHDLAVDIAIELHRQKARIKTL